MKRNLSKLFQLKWNVALFRILPYNAAFAYLQMRAPDAALAPAAD